MKEAPPKTHNVMATVAAISQFHFPDDDDDGNKSRARLSEQEEKGSN